ncbi:coproporphyrinogen III oxidase [Raphidocelis subcapitata]|uniref:Radical S-adenosyl methionine domain-containing protein 1, mitochondrial n=1 Tax=Raphidocelis subcapitata TaxID=307507 RepID=A0A2V0P4U1_9CHLO|nr:coproporphyrinogen III oxidase [Raphidocelis subcapitata]|eukprot:GBF94884.1 coproporphyrinogen III oxidase [Raphidocelis subcapitata]
MLLAERLLRGCCRRGARGGVGGALPLARETGPACAPPAQQPQLRRRCSASSAGGTSPASGAACGSRRRPPPAAAAPADAPQAAAAAAAAAAAPAEAPPAPPPSAAYVHLPFCKRKCFYCDFPVEAVGMEAGRDPVQRRMASYVDTLLREVAATAALNDRASQPLESVYFGGGTPSLVPPPLLGRVLDALSARFGLAAGAEVTIEADPGTFDPERLREYRAMGFNRLSIGVQSFEPGLLSSCGRAHDAASARAALSAAAASGFPSWSLDLMSGLPGLSRASWRATLSEAVSFGPPHISVYDLQVEEGTPFARRYSPGAAPLPADEEAAAMYADASEILTAAGYEHYEVSNYARPGHRSRHNQAYWRLTPHYGFGLGAASYLAGRRYSRPRRMPDWEAWEERLLDVIMLALRTSDGLDLAAVAGDYGPEAARAIASALARHEREGRVVVERAAPSSTAPGGGGEAEGRPLRARLTDPEGFLFSNDVISDVFAAF